MLCAQWHTYSICGGSDCSFAVLSDSWDGGRDTNSDSPPVYVQPTDLDPEPKNRTSINDVIRSQKIIGQPFSSLPHSHSRCSSARQNGSELRSLHCRFQPNGCEITALARERADVVSLPSQRSRINSGGGSLASDF